MSEETVLIQQTVEQDNAADALRAEVLRLQNENINLDGKMRYWKHEANEALGRLELFRRAAVAAGMIDSPGWAGSEEDETR